MTTTPSYAFEFEAGKGAQAKWCKRVLEDGCLRVHVAVPNGRVDGESEKGGKGKMKKALSAVVARLLKLDLSLSRRAGINIVLTSSGDYSVVLDLVFGRSSLNHMLASASSAHVFIGVVNGYPPEEIKISKQDLSDAHQWVVDELGESVSPFHAECLAAKKSPHVMLQGLVTPTESDCDTAWANLLESWAVSAIIGNNSGAGRLAFRQSLDYSGEKVGDEMLAQLGKFINKAIGHTKGAGSLLFAPPGESVRPLPLTYDFSEFNTILQKHTCVVVSGPCFTEYIAAYAKKTRSDGDNGNLIVYHDFGCNGLHKQLDACLASFINQLSPSTPHSEYGAYSTSFMAKRYIALMVDEASKRKHNGHITFVLNNIHQMGSEAALQFANYTHPASLKWLGWDNAPQNVHFVFGTTDAEALGSELALCDSIHFLSLDAHKDTFVPAVVDAIGSTLPVRQQPIVKTIEEKLATGTIAWGTTEHCLDMLALDKEIEEPTFTNTISSLESDSSRALLYTHLWNVNSDASELLAEILGNDVLIRALKLIGASEAGISTCDIIRLFRLSDIEPVYITCMLHFLEGCTRIVRGRLCFPVGEFGSFVQSKLTNGHEEAFAITSLLINQWTSTKIDTMAGTRLVFEKPHLGFLEFRAHPRMVDILSNPKYQQLMFPTHELSINHMELTEEDIAAIATVVEKNHWFTRLNLFGCKMDVPAVVNLMHGVSKSALTAINRGADEVLQGVKKSNITTLFLPHVGLKATGIAPFTTTLATCTNLEYLNISHNAIGDEGMKALAGVVASAEYSRTGCLTGLCASYCGLGDDSRESIVEMLGSKESLAIGLQGNSFSKDTLRGFKQASKLKHTNP